MSEFSTSIAGLSRSWSWIEWLDGWLLKRCSVFRERRRISGSIHQTIPTSCSEICDSSGHGVLSSHCHRPDLCSVHFWTRRIIRLLTSLFILPSFFHGNTDFGGKAFRNFKDSQNVFPPRLGISKWKSNIPALHYRRILLQYRTVPCHTVQKHFQLLKYRKICQGSGLIILIDNFQGFN